MKAHPGEGLLTGMQAFILSSTIEQVKINKGRAGEKVEVPQTGRVQLWDISEARREGWTHGRQGTSHQSNLHSPSKVDIGKLRSATE